MKTYPLPVHVQRFFTDRLVAQLRASPNTIASYRDTFRLLLKYACDRLGRMPTDLQVADIDADLIGGFLSFIETDRGNGARSRNARLSAIRSFFRYVAVNEPQLLHHCQRILAMPAQRHEKRRDRFHGGAVEPGRQGAGEDGQEAGGEQEVEALAARRRPLLGGAAQQVGGGPFPFASQSAYIASRSSSLAVAHSTTAAPPPAGAESSGLTDEP